MIIFPYVLAEFEVGYLRYQTSNVGFVGQTVVATIEKCRGCGHFRHVIDRWRVLKTKNKKERGILMELLRGTQREKKIGKRFRTQDKCVPRAGVISRFSFLVVLWLLQEVFLQVLRFSPLVKKKKPNTSRFQFDLECTCRSKRVSGNSYVLREETNYNLPLNKTL